MAEPISLAASVVALSETGFSVAKFLLDTFKSYRNAPEEVLEIAHEINICSSLMGPFGDRLKTGSVKYNASFQESMEWLVINSTNTFIRIQELMPRNRSGVMGSRVKWDFVLNKSRITTHRRRLKEIQQMFIFVKDAMAHSDDATGVKATDGSSAPSYLPILLTGTGRDRDGNLVSCSLEVKMRPAPTARTRMHDRTPTSNSYWEGEEEDEDTRELTVLRQSPYFSAALLSDRRDSAAVNEEERKSFWGEESSAGLQVAAENVAQTDVDHLLASVSLPILVPRCYVRL